MSNSNDIDPFDGINEIIPDKKTKKQPKEIKMVKEQEKPKESSKGSAKERAQMIFTLQAYGNNKRFGPYLKNDCNIKFDESHLKKMSLDELKLELEKINVSLSNKNNSNMFDVVIKNTIKMAETMITRRSQLQLEGMTDTLLEDDVFLDLVERLKMKYNIGIPFTSLPLEVELLLTIFQTGMICHQKNKFEMSIVDSKIDLNEKVSLNPNEQ